MYQQNMRYAQNNALQHSELPTLKEIALLLVVFALWALIGFVVWHTCKILGGN